MPWARTAPGESGFVTGIVLCPCASRSPLWPCASPCSPFSSHIPSFLTHCFGGTGCQEDRGSGQGSERWGGRVPFVFTGEGACRRSGGPSCSVSRQERQQCFAPHTRAPCATCRQQACPRSAQFHTCPLPHTHACTTGSSSAASPHSTHTLVFGFGFFQMKEQSWAYVTLKRVPSASTSSPFVGRSCSKSPENVQPPWMPDVQEGWTPEYVEPP